MPKPFKLQSTRALPAGAEVVNRDGKPHARMKDRGRAVLYPLTKDGTKFLKPSKRLSKPILYQTTNPAKPTRQRILVCVSRPPM